MFMSWKSFGMVVSFSCSWRYASAALPLVNAKLFMPARRYCCFYLFSAEFRAGNLKRTCCKQVLSVISSHACSVSMQYLKRYNECLIHSLHACIYHLRFLAILSPRPDYNLKITARNRNSKCPKRYSSLFTGATWCRRCCPKNAQWRFESGSQKDQRKKLKKLERRRN